MTYVFDIDGTICRHSSTLSPYTEAEPIVERIDFINRLYNDGNIIVFLTARGMGSSNNTTPNRWKSLTEKQLKEWGVRYHDLFMGKPAGDVYIDDKGINDEEFFRD